MNVSPIQSIPTPQIPRNHVEASEKDADFLLLRLLNKRVRLRISPEPLDLNLRHARYNLFAVGNVCGWFAAVIHSGSSDAICLSSLVDLRSTLLSSTLESGEVNFQPKRILPLPIGTIPTHLTFANNDQKFLVALNGGSVVVYDANELLTSGQNEVSPMQSFQSINGQLVQQLLPNPADLPSLVAVRRSAEGSSIGVAVEILDIEQMRSVAGWMSGSTPDTVPTTISWSPKGKQLAIGLQSGDILTYSPSLSTTVKLHISHPPQTANLSIISSLWLANPTFYAIYAPPGPLPPDVDQKHYVVTQDAKTTNSDVQLTTPNFPSPGLRPPGAMAVVLRNWEPAKFLIFVGDGPSSDIGLVGCVVDSSQETWSNLSLEETSTPSLPLDKDSNDTILLGLEMDLTNDIAVKSGDDDTPDFPAPPVMFAYASDGTVQAWYVINTRGVPYPGMGGSAASTIVDVPMPSTPKPSFATPAANQNPQKPSSPVVAKTFGQQSTPVFGSSSLGQTISTSSSPFGLSQSPQSVFEQTSPFGQSNSSPFASTSNSSPSVFGGGIKPATGFGAFASQEPTKFGLGFGFGLPNNTNVTPAPTLVSTPSATMEDQSIAPPAEMTDANTSTGFGGLSLGSVNDQKSTLASKPSIFGSFGSTAKSTNPAFGSTGFGTSGGDGLKPATGFGAFSAFNQTQSLNPTTTTTTQTVNLEPTKPSTAFGQSGFGQSTFGQSGFNIERVVPAQNITASEAGPSKGGFTAFATGGFSSFGSNTLQNRSTATDLGLAKQTAKESAQAANTISPSGITDKNSFTNPSMFMKPSASPFAFSPHPPASTPSSTSLRALSSSPSPEGSPKFGVFAKNRPVTPVSPTEVSESLFGFETPQASEQLRISSNSPSPDDKIKQHPVTFGSLSLSNDPTKTAESTIKPLTGFGAFGGTPKTSLFGKPSNQTSSSKGAVSSPESGAFSGLQTTPNAFGSGTVFSSPNKSVSSPASDKDTENKTKSGGGSSVFGGTAKSVFGSGGTGLAGKTGSPAFGSTSFPGSPPGSSTVDFSANVTASLSPKGSNAFSAFAGGSPSFSSFGNTGTGKISFNDLLKQKGDEKEEDKFKVTPALSRSNSEASKTEEETDYVNVEGVVQDLAASGISDSFSFVDVSPDVVGQVQHPDSIHSPGDSEEDALNEDDLEQYDDDAASFISASLSDEDDEDDEDDTKSKTTTDIKAELKKSDPKHALLPSGTDQSTNAVSKQPSVDSVSNLPTESTTPPTSPQKQNRDTIVSPKPVVPSSSSSTINFGLGRPTTRPNRSSPLASVPLSAEVAKSEYTGAVSPPALSKARPASPKKPFGQLSGGNAGNNSTSSISTSPSPPNSQTQAKVMSFGRSSPTQSHTPPLFHSLQKSTVPPVSITKSLSGPPFLSTPVADNLLPASTRPQTPPVAIVSSASSSSQVPFLFGAGNLPSSPFGQTKPFSFGKSEVAPTSPASPTVALPGDPEKSIVKPSVFAFGPEIQTSKGFATSKISQEELGLHEQFETLYKTMTNELEQLKKDTKEMSDTLEKMTKHSFVQHTKGDLADPSKWSFAELAEFRKTLETLEDDILKLKQSKASMAEEIKEIESNQLKLATRMEEIKKFAKTKDDPEFKKMLKSRTLGPEYAEMQNNLRRKLRNVMSRTEQLEQHMQSCKRKLNESRTGKPTIKAPTLDSIDRTYRNLDVASTQLLERIAALTARVKKLELNSQIMDPSSLNSRSNRAVTKDQETMLNRESIEVTPEVAAIAADALNSERFAYRVKKAMQNWQPKINQQAIELLPSAPSLENIKRLAALKKVDMPQTPSNPAHAPASIPVINTPQNPSTPSPNLISSPNLTGSSLFGLNNLTSELVSSIPESQTLRRNERSTRHTKPVTLKRSPQNTTSPISTFDWGPVPPVKPMSSLSVMKPHAEGSGSQN